ncbi:hypothetical protein DW884_09150 [Ruminococcus sp. AM40-10AC]|nr:hypothetical protein DW884_09150 [Ruminococcus sp. AM40-10AC]
MLKNLTVRIFLTVIFLQKNIRLQNNAGRCGLNMSLKVGIASSEADGIKKIAKKSAKIRLLFIFLSILYLTTKTDGFLTVRKSGLQLRDTKHISQKNSLPAAVKRLLCCLRAY